MTRPVLTRRLGLRAKLTLAVSALVVAFAAFFTLYFPRRQEAAAAEALERRAVVLAGVMAELVQGPVVMGSELGNAAEEAEKYLRSAQNDPDLRHVAVLDGAGKLLAKYVAAGAALDERQLQVAAALRIVADDDLLEVAVPVRGQEGQIAGTLVIGFSRQPVAAVRRESRTAALVVSAIILLLGVTLAWIVTAGLSRPLLAASGQMDRMSAELLAAAREQETSAAQEAAAIEETRRTMESLLDSAQQIADGAGVVLGNAERTLEGGKLISERIRDLNLHAEKVAEILATIMQVADRTDLLALNAALEGTRAGDAGKGFTLVASEMRALAENVMESVTAIRKLLKDVRDASQSAVKASEDGTGLSDATTRSAREIALATQEQRKGTTQVNGSMEEMSQLLRHTVANVRKTGASAEALSRLAQELAILIRPGQARVVRGGGDGRGNGDAQEPRPAASPVAGEERW